MQADKKDVKQMPKGNVSPKQSSRKPSQPEPVKTSQQIKQFVPQFYFPQGKPSQQTELKAVQDTMDKIFGKAPGK